MGCFLSCCKQPNRIAPTISSTTIQTLANQTVQILVGQNLDKDLKDPGNVHLKHHDEIISSTISSPDSSEGQKMQIVAVLVNPQVHNSIL